MLTAIYSLGRVNGAGIWIIGFLICACIFFAVCCAFRQNRSKRGLVAVVLGLLACEAVCDTIWFFAYYPNGEYHNYGIGGVSGILLWPGTLCLAGMIVTNMNRYFDKRDDASAPVCPENGARAKSGSLNRD